LLTPVTPVTQSVTGVTDESFYLLVAIFDRNLASFACWFLPTGKNWLGYCFGVFTYWYRQLRLHMLALQA
jgi:hypothetical protein